MGKPRTSKLTDEQAADIYLDTRSAVAIAKAYGVSRGVVHNIRKRHSYREATEGLEAPERDTLTAQRTTSTALTDDQARAAFLDPRPAHVVAEELGVGRSTIANIRTKRRYQWATEGLTRG